jgi:hypothetical protein
MKKPVTFLFLLSFFFSATAAQSEGKINDVLAHHFENIRINKTNQPLDGIIFNPSFEKKVLGQITPYLKDSLSRIRAEAYHIIKRIGQASSELTFRQKTVEYLIEACKDKDNANSGMSCRYLCGFNKDDFSTLALDSLKHLLKAFLSHYETLIRLAGYLDLQDMAPFLGEFVKSHINSNKQSKWSAHLALARMGDEGEIQFCLRLASHLPVDEEMVSNLLPDLIYTRQKELIDYCIEILCSNEKSCVSAANGSAEKISCGYRVMGLLAPVINDYPLKTNASGDIVIDNDEKSLKTVRAWFKSRNGKYIINTDHY